MSDEKVKDFKFFSECGLGEKNKQFLEDEQECLNSEGYLPWNMEARTRMIQKCKDKNGYLFDKETCTLKKITKIGTINGHIVYKEES